MLCPVCGDTTADDVCGRCGTDLRALAGEEGDVHLEIVAIHASTDLRTSRKPTA